MRISDWSSDVCSSDLAAEGADVVAHPAQRRGLVLEPGVAGARVGLAEQVLHPQEAERAEPVVDGDHDDVVVERERGAVVPRRAAAARRERSSVRSEEHTSELQSLMRISYAVFCLKKKKKDD